MPHVIVFASNLKSVQNRDKVMGEKSDDLLASCFRLAICHSNWDWIKNSNQSCYENFEFFSLKIISMQWLDWE